METWLKFKEPKVKVTKIEEVFSIFAENLSLSEDIFKKPVS